MHQDYAKITLFLFYLLRKLEDIQLDGSYWKLFYREFQMFKNHKVTIMWLKGFEILQNLEHWHAMIHPNDETLLLKIPPTNLIQKGNQWLENNHTMKFPILPKWIGVCLLFSLLPWQVFMIVHKSFFGQSLRLQWIFKLYQFLNGQPKVQLCDKFWFMWRISLYFLSQYFLFSCFDEVSMKIW